MPKLKDENPPDSVLIKVALAEVRPQTWRYHINTDLTTEQSLALRRVTAALDQQLAKL